MISVNAGFPVRESAFWRYDLELMSLECVEFLDARTMQAINRGGLAGRQYNEVDSLFFKFQGSVYLTSPGRSRLTILVDPTPRWQTWPRTFRAW